MNIFTVFTQYSEPPAVGQEVLIELIDEVRVGVPQLIPHSPPPTGCPPPASAGAPVVFVAASGQTQTEGRVCERHWSQASYK